MPVFVYKGLDGAGKGVAGVVDADNAKIARTRLRRQGVFVTDVREQLARATSGSGLNVEIDFSKYFQFVTTRDISTVTTQLSTLVGAHVPIGEGLAALVDQAEKSKVKVVLSRIKERVNEGTTLADAMADHPHLFDDLYVQMVRAGEKSGALGQVLQRLAKFIDSRVRLQGKVATALAYPALMTVVGSLILIALFNFVIPRVRGMFEQMSSEVTLPLITRVVFVMGDTFSAVWWTIPPIVVALWWGVRRYGRTESGRQRVDAMKLRLPVVGHLNRMVAVARFCRTLSTLLVSGVPILQALAIVRGTVGNVVIGAAIASAAVNIQEGQSVAAPLKASGQFPPMVTHMIAIGERTGELEKMLTIVADAYDDEVETAIATLTSVLAPIAILVMGGIVLFVALGLLLPMTQLSRMI